VSNLWTRTLSGNLAGTLRGVWSENLLQKFTGILGANAFNNFATFLITVYTARALGPEEFGRLALSISITFLLSLILDFGLSITLVRIYNIETSPEERAGYIRTIVGFKILSLLALVPLAFVLQGITTQVLPVLSGYGSLVYLAFLCGGLHSIWTTVRAAEQARRDFRSFRRYTFIYGVLRFLGFGTLLLFYEVSPTSVLAVLYALPPTGLILYSWFSDYRPFWSATAVHACRSSAYSRLKTAFSYGKWVALSGICYVTLLYIPQFMLARAANETEVGLYGAGLTFVAAFSLVNDALRTVILPDVTALSSSSDRLAFRRRFLRLGPAFFSVALFALGFMAFAQYYLLGGAFTASIPIFIILGLATIVTIYLGIFNLLVHSHGVPKLEAINNLARMAALTLLLLVGPKTALSACLTSAGVLVVGELIVYAILRFKDAGHNIVGSRK
jgi:O-antigen/teichoic acid export membrane protein